MTLYFVETTTGRQRELLCRWTEKFYGEGRKVEIAVDSTQSAQFIDQMLWTFSQPAFLPHSIVAARPEPAGNSPDFDPILIVIGEQRIPGFDTLLCDFPADLDFLQNFETSVHFILRDDEQMRSRSRILWQKARDLGLQPVHVPYGSAV